MRKKVWKGIFLLTAALGVTGCSKGQTADPPSAIPAQENRAESKEEEAVEHEKIQGKTESEIKKGAFSLGFPYMTLPLWKQMAPIIFSVPIWRLRSARTSGTGNPLPAESEKAIPCSPTYLILT